MKPGTPGQRGPLRGGYRPDRGFPLYPCYLGFAYRSGTADPIDLVAPEGSTYRLKSSSTSDSADNVNTTHTVDASSGTANGTWKLRVQDVAASDTGKLNRWKPTL